MDSSRRAVEAYWRSRMVDGVTSDEDKVAPVYKLEEICDLLRNSHASIVKEVSVYILKRLDHKSPIVKQKVLRLIKYSVGKSGVEFQREMQRQSAVMRELYRYQGQPDPLKGDALNKAVRDSAHEAVTALFANANNESTLVAPTEGTQKRIEGFGNTNYTMPTEEKKSFLSEVVGIGLSTIAAANSMRKSDNGSYKSPNLRRSLTTEVSGRDRYEVEDYKSENYSSAILSKNVPSGTWSQDVRTVVINASANEDNASNHTGIKSREERLLDTIVTSGGVRLQPTRDAIQVFLTEALKLDAVSLSRALEMKLQSPLWQVRMKACCILESILRKKDDEHFSIIASYFSENSDSLVRCSDLPQVSLREKATKVLHLLDGDQQSGTRNQAEPSKAKSMPAPPVQMPDLIDTGEPDDDGSEALAQLHVDQNTGDLTSSGSLVDDLLDDGQISGLINSETTREDPFADVSFHATEEKQNEDDPFADVSFCATEEKQLEDIFSGLTVDDKKQQHEHKISKESGLLDYFSTSNSVHLTQEAETSKGNADDLMAGLTFNATVQENKQSKHIPPNSAFNGGLGAPMQYNIPPNMMFDPAFATQQMNYGAMGAFIAQQQQQLLYQNLGNLNTGYGQQQLLYQNLGNLSTGYGRAAGNALDGGHSSSPLPDIFHPSNNLVQSPASVLTGSKKEDTKAFDFISDHISTARGSKRV